MSFLFDKKTKKTVRIVWSIFGILIIISMLFFFAPGLIPGTGYSGIF